MPEDLDPMSGSTVKKLILLGEPLTRGRDEICEARKNTEEQLKPILSSSGINVVYWDDGWAGKLGPSVNTGDEDALFLQVVDEDAAGIIGDQPDLLTYPLRRKLGQADLGKTIQVVVWRHDGGGTAMQTGQAPEIVTFISCTRADLPKRIKSICNAQRQPPVISLERYTEGNKPIGDTLVAIVAASTERCDPPIPPLWGFEPTNSADEDIDKSRLVINKILSTYGPKGGVIVAIHDLSLNAPMDALAALNAIRSRMMNYEYLLSDELAAVGISPERILKLAVVMNMREVLIGGEFPENYKIEGWEVVGMERDNEQARLTNDTDRALLKRKVDALLDAQT
ncbi:MULTISPECIES: hypothetical protein [Microvirga]|uniref:hypothetical protein n=1 Tax=Microvirga TaxID=186650 RepID=UPI0016826B56|nr:MULTISPECIES: hypothetical protein [Microvirga]MBD2750929.1 hypothetical protein [Microvirga sp.]